MTKKEWGPSLRLSAAISYTLQHLAAQDGRSYQNYVERVLTNYINEIKGFKKQGLDKRKGHVRYKR